MVLSIVGRLGSYCSTLRSVEHSNGYTTFTFVCGIRKKMYDDDGSAYDMISKLQSKGARGYTLIAKGVNSDVQYCH